MASNSLITCNSTSFYQSRQIGREEKWLNGIKNAYTVGSTNTLEGSMMDIKLTQKLERNGKIHLDSYRTMIASRMWHTAHYIPRFARFMARVLCGISQMSLRSISREPFITYASPNFRYARICIVIDADKIVPHRNITKGRLQRI